MISRSLPSDRQMPLDYIALGDSTVYGLGASSPSTHYVARLFRLVQSEYPATRLTNLGCCLVKAAEVLTDQLPHAFITLLHLMTFSVGPNNQPKGHSPYDLCLRVDCIV